MSGFEQQLTEFSEPLEVLGPLQQLVEILQFHTQNLKLGPLVVPLLRLLRQDSNIVQQLALQALNLVFDINPQHIQTLHYERSLSRLCEIVLAATDQDLTEQALKCLEYGSMNHPGAILDEGGIRAVLAYFSYWNTPRLRHFQKTALQLSCRLIERIYTQEHLLQLWSVLPTLCEAFDSDEQSISSLAAECLLCMFRALNNIIVVSSRSKRVAQHARSGTVATPAEIRHFVHRTMQTRIARLCARHCFVPVGGSNQEQRDVCWQYVQSALQFDLGWLLLDRSLLQAFLAAVCRCAQDVQAEELNVIPPCLDAGLTLFPTEEECVDLMQKIGIESLHEDPQAIETARQVLMSTNTSSSSAAGPLDAAVADLFPALQKDEAKLPEQWSCVACTYLNAPDRLLCDMCETPNPSAPQGAATGTCPWAGMLPIFNSDELGEPTELEATGRSSRGRAAQTKHPRTVAFLPPQHGMIVAMAETVGPDLFRLFVDDQTPLKLRLRIVRVVRMLQLMCPEALAPVEDENSSATRQCAQLHELVPGVLGGLCNMLANVQPSDLLDENTEALMTLLTITLAFVTQGSADVRRAYCDLLMCHGLVPHLKKILDYDHDHQEQAQQTSGRRAAGSRNSASPISLAKDILVAVLDEPATVAQQQQQQQQAAKSRSKKRPRSRFHTMSYEELVQLLDSIPASPSLVQLRSLNEQLQAALSQLIAGTGATGVTGATAAAETVLHTLVELVNRAATSTAYELQASGVLRTLRGLLSHGIDGLQQTISSVQAHCAAHNLETLHPNQLVAQIVMNALFTADGADCSGSRLARMVASAIPVKAALPLIKHTGSAHLLSASNALFQHLRLQLTVSIPGYENIGLADPVLLECFVEPISTVKEFRDKIKHAASASIERAIAEYKRAQAEMASSDPPRRKRDADELLLGPCGLGGELDEPRSTSFQSRTRFGARVSLDSAEPVRRARLARATSSSMQELSAHSMFGATEESAALEARPAVSARTPADAIASIRRVAALTRARASYPPAGTAPGGMELIEPWERDRHRGGLAAMEQLLRAPEWERVDDDEREAAAAASHGILYGNRPFPAARVAFQQPRRGEYVRARLPIFSAEQPAHLSSYARQRRAAPTFVADEAHSSSTTAVSALAAARDERLRALNELARHEQTVHDHIRARHAVAMETMSSSSSEHSEDDEDEKVVEERRHHYLHVREAEERFSDDNDHDDDDEEEGEVDDAVHRYIRRYADDDDDVEEAEEEEDDDDENGDEAEEHGFADMAVSMETHTPRTQYHSQRAMRAVTDASRSSDRDDYHAFLPEHRAPAAAESWVTPVHRTTRSSQTSASAAGAPDSLGSPDLVKTVRITESEKSVSEEGVIRRGAKPPAQQRVQRTALLSAAATADTEHNAGESPKRRRVGMSRAVPSDVQSSASKAGSSLLRQLSPPLRCVEAVEPDSNVPMTAPKPRDIELARMHLKAPLPLAEALPSTASLSAACVQIDFSQLPGSMTMAEAVQIFTWVTNELTAGRSVAMSDIQRLRHRQTALTAVHWEQAFHLQVIAGTSEVLAAAGCVPGENPPGVAVDMDASRAQHVSTAAAAAASDQGHFHSVILLGQLASYCQLLSRCAAVGVPAGWTIPSQSSLQGVIDECCFPNLTRQFLLQQQDLLAQTCGLYPCWFARLCSDPLLQPLISFDARFRVAQNLAVGRSRRIQHVKTLLQSGQQQQQQQQQQHRQQQQQQYLRSEFAYLGRGSMDRLSALGDPTREKALLRREKLLHDGQRLFKHLLKSRSLAVLQRSAQPYVITSQESIEGDTFAEPSHFVAANGEVLVWPQVPDGMFGTRDDAAEVTDAMREERSRNVMVEFSDERGHGEGPTQEFYTLMCRELMDPSTGVWQVQEDHSQVPLRAGQADEGRGTKLFRVVGYLLAKALQDSRLLDLPLHSAVLSAVLAKLASEYSVMSASTAAEEGDDHHDDEDGPDAQPQRLIAQPLFNFAQMEPAMWRSMRRLLTATKRDELAAMELTFTLPGCDQVELCEGGTQRRVDTSNVQEFVQRVVEFACGDSLDTAVSEVVRGVAEFVPLTALSCLQPRDLQAFVTSPNDELWDAGTILSCIVCKHGYTSQSRQVQDLVAVMSEFDQQQRMHFLQFVTGAPRLPMLGFRGLQPPMTIVKKEPLAGVAPDETLPSCSTCQVYLKLPEYSSRATLRAKVLQAITEGREYFALD